MIIDTSALIAMLWNEAGRDQISRAVVSGGGMIPTPVLVEFHRVSKLKDNAIDPQAVALVEWLLAGGNILTPLDDKAALAAVLANARFGSGSGHAAKLNMLDLMVYGVAETNSLPILCTGKDFTHTDAAIHPASRLD